MGPGELAIIMLVGGLAAGMIARSHFRTARGFRVFFVIGALFPVLGVLAAYLAKRFFPRPVAASSS